MSGKLSRYAEEMRDHPTKPEKMLWCEIRGMDGLTWETQVVMYGYIVDFYCSEKNLAVEVDGLDHELNYEYDRKRDGILRNYGIKTIRISAHDILEDLHATVERLRTSVMQFDYKSWIPRSKQSSGFERINPKWTQIFDILE